MSCGQPHEVDCLDVLEQVYLYLDGEIDEAHRQEVRDHIDECSPCLRQFGIEQEVKALVARCCGGESAPQALRDRLTVTLSQVSLEMVRLEFRAE
jgi:mycothiol system anti-sigma-R factor